MFRRRIRLCADDTKVEVALEDGNHGFRLRLAHDGSLVTALEAQAIRHPFGTCAEATQPLRLIVGHRLADGVKQLRDRLAPGEHCTHLFDMAMLAVAHAGRGRRTFEYDVAIDDETTAPARAEIRRDGQPVHLWTIRSHEVAGPPGLAGRPMMRGFHAWASQAFEGDALEAALVLQRGYFVAQSRRFDFDPPHENPAVGDRMPHGSCYSYNTGVVERAFRSAGTVRDFTHTADRLLRFERGA